MSRLKLHLLSICAALSTAVLVAGFAQPSLAQTAAGTPVPDPSDVEQFADALLKASQQPDKSFAIVLAIIVLVSTLRRLPVMQTDRAGAGLALVLSGLGGVATALAAGQPLDVTVIASSIGLGLKAIGGYVGARKLFGLKSEEAR